MKDYKADDKFRPLKKDFQIVFSNDTRIQDLDEGDVSIEHCVFDFYDLGDLKQLSKQTTYLTGMSSKLSYLIFFFQLQCLPIYMNICFHFSGL